MAKKYNTVIDNSLIHAQMITNEMFKTKSDYSNSAIISKPQTGKDLVAQYIAKFCADRLKDNKKFLILLNVLCDSNIETKNQMIERRQQFDSPIAELYRARDDFVCITVHRNELDGFFKGTMQIGDIGFCDESGKITKRLPPQGLASLKEIIDEAYVVSIFDEFHQHIHADKSIQRLHEFIGVSPTEVNKERPVFYITATGSALCTFIKDNPESKINLHVMTEPEGYYGLEDYIKDGRYFDWELFADADRVKCYENIFNFLAKPFSASARGCIVMRATGLKGEAQEKFDLLANEFCQDTGAKLAYVDMDNSGSVQLFKSALESKPAGGPFAQYSASSQKYLFVLKQMFGCGQTIAKQNILWWITPPAVENNPTSIQRDTRPAGLYAGEHQINIIGPLSDAQAYIEAFDELKKGNLAPMTELDNQLIDTKSEIDYGWVYRVVDSSEVVLRSGYGWHYLSGMGTRTSSRRGVVDVSQLVALAIEKRESKTNIINNNSVGGTKNVIYTDPDTQEEYECYSMRIDRENPNDFSDYWNSDLKKHEGQVLIAYRGRPTQKIKKEMKANNKFMMKSYQAA